MMPQDAVHPAAGEHAFLHREFGVSALVEPSADLGVLALHVFAQHDEIDVAKVAIPKRRGQARIQPDRPQAHVLLETAADRNEQPPQRDVIRHAGVADRAEEDGVVVTELFEPVFRHHATRPPIRFAAPVKVIEAEVDSESPARGFQHTQSLGDYFLPDAIPGDHGNTIGLHGISPARMPIA
jgi:hypothetical protein